MGCFLHLLTTVLEIACSHTVAWHSPCHALVDPDRRKTGSRDPRWIEESPPVPGAPMSHRLAAGPLCKWVCGFLPRHGHSHWCVWGNEGANSEPGQSSSKEDVSKQ